MEKVYGKKIRIKSSDEKENERKHEISRVNYKGAKK